MGENSKISWTDHTFNPWIGCCKVSAGCKNCYAERQMTRKGRWANTWGPGETTDRLRTSLSYWNKPVNKWNPEAQRSGKRTKVFCGSLCDVFEDHPQAEEIRPDLWRLISQTPHLDWLLLTKRPENVPAMYPGALPPNVWLGTSVEDQESADLRMPQLFYNDAAIYWLSVEPLLGPITFDTALQLIDWVIVGGESGPHYRPMQFEWVTAIQAQCAKYHIPFFFKQWGGNDKAKGGDLLDGRHYHNFPKSGTHEIT